jgi:translation initiation factor 2 alpha subunit (eIF-2alpha)
VAADWQPVGLLVVAALAIVLGINKEIGMVNTSSARIRPRQKDKYIVKTKRKQRSRGSGNRAIG